MVFGLVCVMRIADSISMEGLCVGLCDVSGRTCLAGVSGAMCLAGVVRMHGGVSVVQVFRGFGSRVVLLGKVGGVFH